MNLSHLQGPFSLRGDYLNASPYGSGHINDTFAVVYNQAGRNVRYIHQRINDKVFTNVPKLMENICCVTEHVRLKLSNAGRNDGSRRSLSVLTVEEDGLPYFVDADGKYWRTYYFIEGARTYDRAETSAQAWAAAHAIGEFQAFLSDLPGGQLHETIPGFHDTRSRFDDFQKAIEADVANRAAGVKEEISWYLARENLTEVVTNALRSGEIPERVSHNDTKLNNVMLDDETMEGICVIDLDTVMPGSCLFDFGDMVRSVTNRAREDEEDPAKVRVDMALYEAILAGYLGSAKSI